MPRRPSSGECPGLRHPPPGRGGPCSAGLPARAWRARSYDSGSSLPGLFGSCSAGLPARAWRARSYDSGSSLPGLSARAWRARLGLGALGRTTPGLPCRAFRLVLGAPGSGLARSVVRLRVLCRRLASTDRPIGLARRGVSSRLVHGGGPGRLIQAETSPPTLEIRLPVVTGDGSSVGRSIQRRAIDPASGDRSGRRQRIIPADRRRTGFVSVAAKDGQRRVAWIVRIGLRALAQAERAPAPGGHDPRVATALAQTDGRAAVRRRHRADPPRGRVAERVGFEPTKSFDSALFKSAAINRSATSPVRRIPATSTGFATSDRVISAGRTPPTTRSGARRSRRASVEPAAARPDRPDPGPGSRARGGADRGRS
jgi:hypothetical protein